MRVEERRIDVEPGVEVSSVWAYPMQYEPGTSAGLILAHGAGTDMRSPFLTFLQEALATRGMLTVKFNFAYREAGRKVPDPPQRLMLTWRKVIERVRADAGPGALFLGGRSMGGRIASMVAAEGEPADGLVLLGYPLQPAGRPEVVRSEHLARITSPLLFVQGSQDRLCDLALLRSVLAKLSAPSTVHVIEEGDHSFKVPKRSGKTEQQVWDDIVTSTASWLKQMTPAGPRTAHTARTDMRRGADSR
jgi:predicted alpha/beta-hydrolase family hydrolase